MGGHSDGYMHQMWGSQLGVLENPLLATPPPRGFGAYREELLETPEKATFTAPSFASARARMLAVRAHMGRRPIPQDLKIRASYPDPSGMDKLFPELEIEEPTTSNTVAGALLLQLVRGEVSPGTSKEGAEQGTQLLSLIKTNGHHRFKKESSDYAAAPLGNIRREQRVPSGLGDTRTVPVAAAPSRAEIRKAAAAARELEKSSKVEDCSEKIKSSGTNPAVEAMVKGQSAGRPRNAKRINPTDPVKGPQFQ
jgi:hypothetical protein